MQYINLTDKDFKWCKLKEKEILDFPNKAKIALEEEFKKIKSIPKKDRNFVNTILAYDRAGEEYNVLHHQIHTLSLLSSNKNIREAARRAEIEYSKYMIDFAYDYELYLSIFDYINFNFKKERKSLKPEDIKLVLDIKKGFEKMGFHLDFKKRNKLKIIDKKLAELENKYDANLNEDNSFILCSKEELDGLPEKIINSFSRQDAKYKITIQYPDYGPFMRYARNRQKRKELYKLFNNAGGRENVLLLKKIIKLKQEKAKILGFENYASYKLKYKMAKNPDKVYSLLNNLLKKLFKKLKQENKDLENIAKENNIKKVELYDEVYLSNLLKEKLFNLNDQKIREYFELNKVLDFIFNFFGELFNFEVKEKSFNLWHKDAKIFALVDRDTKQEIAYLALDLYPREGKYGHACMMPVINGYKINDNLYQAPFAVLICNFPKPNKNTPSLLNLGEVETIFHEFGHGLHGLLTKAKHISQSGTNVIWDFVEVPSQIMEYWLMQEKVLYELSEHYLTKEKIPKDLLQNILKAKKFRLASFYTRQILQGLLDMDLYTKKAKDPVKHFHYLMQKYFIALPKDILFASRFSHIVSGYDAGYYSYLWAEVIARDLFSVFLKKGIENKTIGQKYRVEILEPGSSRDEIESVKRFLGREYNNKAFVEFINNQEL